MYICIYNINLGVLTVTVVNKIFSARHPCQVI